MYYDIYPCDLTLYGECPHRVQNCADCVGWMDSEADEKIQREQDIRKELDYD